jgi:hypothetical protein
MIFMAVDGAGTDRRYRFKIMPRAQVVAVSDEVWSQSSVTKYPVTVRATVDSALGYAVRNVLAGPGQKARNTAEVRLMKLQGGRAAPVSAALDSSTGAQKENRMAGKSVTLTDPNGGEFLSPPGGRDHQPGLRRWLQDQGREVRR